MIRKKRRGVGHAAARTRRTESTFTGERHDPVVPAGLAPNTAKAVAEDPALEEAAELVLHEARVPRAEALARIGEEGLEVLPDDAMEHGEFRAAARVAGLAAGASPHVIQLATNSAVYGWLPFPGTPSESNGRDPRSWSPVVTVTS